MKPAGFILPPSGPSTRQKSPLGFSPMFFVVNNRLISQDEIFVKFYRESQQSGMSDA
jgi:hypothetical protein